VEMWVALSDEGKPDGLAHVELAYKNTIGKVRVRPSGEGSTIYVASLPYLLTRYASIVGLSGSLGGESEKKYLETHFNADFVTVPNFLNTCDNTEKCEPLLVGGGVYVMPSEAALQSRVADLALEKRKKVPVVIICGADNERRLNLIKSLKASSAPFVDSILDISSDAANIEGLVKDATEQKEGHSWWPISVVDYEGGRGQDYRTIDKSVDQDGGLMVIMTEVPDKGVKEWVQWKGRTARSDRKGQYAVVLLEASIGASPKAAKAAGEENLYAGIDLIVELLKEKDEILKADLDRKASKLEPKSALNNLCDDFYRHFRTQVGQSFWKCAWFDQMKALSAFLDSAYLDSEQSSAASIAAMRQQLGLP